MAWKCESAMEPRNCLMEFPIDDDKDMSIIIHCGGR